MTVLANGYAGHIVSARAYNRAGGSCRYIDCRQILNRHLRLAQASLLVMEYLPPPADVLRRSLTAGGVFPHLAPHIASFMARTLFSTSLFALDSKAWRCVLSRVCEQRILLFMGYLVLPGTHLCRCQACVRHVCQSVWKMLCMPCDGLWKKSS